jgi:tryptophan halogenase
MAKRISHVTIVGGGTAGWLAAALLDAGLNRRNDGPNVRITVIESPNIPSIGVGEATTISMRLTCSQLGLHERDFLKRCNGSFKGAVKFSNWDKEPDGSPRSYFHPFDHPGFLHVHNIVYNWLAWRRKGNTGSLAETVVPSMGPVTANRAPLVVGAQEFKGFYPYAYHFDAKLFADYMTEFSTALGVEHVRDDVTEVNLAEDGSVKSLTLKERGDWPIEFVIDCTGFRGLIIKQALKEPFIPYGENLLCDKALALQIPHERPDRLESYTSSTGLNSGWSWRVPLYHRLGTGYVFSSAFASDDDAIREFRGYLKLPEDHPDPRVVAMHIGRVRNSWVKNCLAIGLAGGFIEPLESTSIHFTQMALRFFVEFFPDMDNSPVYAREYNKIASEMYEEVREFIALHYHTSNRTDTPFWLAARNDTKMPDGLAERLELWKRKLPGPLECNRPWSLFEQSSYAFVLAGKGFFDGLEFPHEGTVSVEDFEKYLREAAKRRQHLMSSTKDHYKTLTAIHKGSYTPWYNPAPSEVPDADMPMSMDLGEVPAALA